jgi:hypothetical protein
VALEALDLLAEAVVKQHLHQELAQVELVEQV